MAAERCDRYPATWPPVLVGHYLTRAVAHRGSATAIIAGDASCTYAELDALVSAYAATLLEANVAHGDALLVVMEPGIELVATFVAVTRIGAIHVPCNAGSPAVRLADIARKVRATAIVTTDGATVAGEPASSEEALDGIPIFHAGRRSLDAPRPVRRAARAPRSTIESDVAYVIFTSGSTGQPKGVVMTHRAAVVAFRGIEAACDVRGRLASCAPAGFDLSILDMAAALGRGETIAFVPRQVQLHPLRLIEYLACHEVTQMHSVPSLWQILERFARDRIGELEHLQKIVLGGEALSPKLVTDLRSRLPGLRVLNLYGQTESICCSFYEVPQTLPPDATSIPVGEPYPGVDMILIDESGREVVGDDESGELYLRAASMFSGYWEDAEQTARQIVANPTDPDAKDRWLRTGDVLRRQPDGLHFVGRVDRQVQLFGNRVELGEIEECLVGHGGVAAANVVAISTSEWEHTRAVVAFVEPYPAHSDGLEPADLLAHCRARLPKYMVPSTILLVDSWSLAATGKVDLAALEERAREWHESLRGGAVCVATPRELD